MVCNDDDNGTLINWTPHQAIKAMLGTQGNMWMPRFWQESFLDVPHNWTEDGCVKQGQNNCL